MSSSCSCYVYSESPLPEASFAQIRQLALDLLTEELYEIIEKWEEKNGIGPQYYEELAKGHFHTTSK
jgi:hypothetical protein